MESYRIFSLAVVLLLLIISIIDIKKMELPDSLTFLLIVLGLVYHGFYTGRITESVIGMGLYALPFSLIYGYVSEIIQKEALGFGDVKLAMGIGACLTYTSLEEAYLFFLFSFVIGAIYSIFLLIKIKLKGEENVNREFPFAPFISMSGSIIILMGRVL